MRKTTAFVAALIVLFQTATAVSGPSSIPEEAAGSFEDGVYMNPYLGFGFRCDGWVFLSDEDLLDRGGTNARILGPDYLTSADELLEETVMAATLPDYGDTVIVAVRYLGSSAAYYEALGEEFLMENLADSYKSSFTDPFILDSFEITELSINGYELPCYRIEYSFSTLWYGGSIHAVYTMFISEDYLVTVTASAGTMDSVYEALRHLFWM